jgi:hypothetical protein
MRGVVSSDLKPHRVIELIPFTLQNELREVAKSQGFGIGAVLNELVTVPALAIVPVKKAGKDRADGQVRVNGKTGAEQARIDKAATAAHKATVIEFEPVTEAPAPVEAEVPAPLAVAATVPEGMTAAQVKRAAVKANAAKLEAERKASVAAKKEENKAKRAAAPAKEKTEKAAPVPVQKGDLEIRPDLTLELKGIATVEALKEKLASFGEGFTLANCRTLVPATTLVQPADEKGWNGRAVVRGYVGEKMVFGAWLDVVTKSCVVVRVIAKN